MCITPSYHNATATATANRCAMHIHTAITCHSIWVTKWMKMKRKSDAFNVLNNIYIQMHSAHKHNTTAYIWCVYAFRSNLIGIIKKKKKQSCFHAIRLFIFFRLFFFCSNVKDCLKVVWLLCFSFKLLTYLLTYTYLSSPYLTLPYLTYLHCIIQSNPLTLSFTHTHSEALWNSLASHSANETEVILRCSSLLQV